MATWDKGEFTAYEIPGGSVALLNFVWGWQPPGYEAIIVERYTITPNTAKLSQQHDPLEAIGGLRWMAALWQIPFVLQSPADAKRFADNGRLKRLGWKSSGAGHNDDAARHLLLYCVKERIIDPKDLL
jgi:hypothetical protein